MDKKDKKGLKEDVAKTVLATVMDTIDQKIENAVDKVNIEANLNSSQGPSTTDLVSKMDQFDLKNEELDKKMDDLILDLARMSDKVSSASERGISLEEWKNSGVICSKSDMILFFWGLMCIQVR